MTPFPKQRREAKHDARHRQLPVLAVVLSLTLEAAWAVAETPAASSAKDELRAAKLVETALLARPANAEETRKMDEIYAGLAAKYPRDATIRNAHAEFLRSIGEPKRAAELWEEVVQIEPKNAVVLDHLADHWLGAGDVKKSAAFYARAVGSAPENAGYRFAFANVTFLFRHELLSAAQPDEAAVLDHALADFAEASRLAPLNAEYARAYAETFYSVSKADWNAALAAWQHFAEISPQKDFAQANLARIYIKLGQSDAARACLEKIQGADFQNLKSKLSGQIDTSRPAAARP